LIDETLSASMREASAGKLFGAGADGELTEADREFWHGSVDELFGAGGHDDSVGSGPAQAATEAAADAGSGPAQAATEAAADAALVAELTEGIAKCWIAQATEAFLTLMDAYKAKQAFPLGHNNNLSLVACRTTASSTASYSKLAGPIGAVSVHVVNWGGLVCSATHLVGRSCPMTHPKVFGGPRWAKWPTSTLFKPMSFEGSAVCSK
jgi:RecA/RadA recombinase